MTFRDKIRQNKWYVFFLLLAALALGFICVYCRESLFYGITFIYRNRAEISWYILPLSLVIGIVDTIVGDPKDHTLALFKKIPVVLASPLSCLTYGVVICSSTIFLHIVFFNPGLFSPYTLLDRITLTCSFIILLFWAIWEMWQVIIDLFKKHLTGTEGTIEQ